MKDRKIEIVGLLSHGWKAAEIAKELFISRRTVEKHVEILKAAYEAKNTAHLVAEFMRKGIIK